MLNTLGGALLDQAIKTKTRLGPETIEYMLRIDKCSERSLRYCQEILSLLSQTDEEKYIETLLSGIHQENQKKNMAESLFLPLFRKKKGIISLTLLAYIWNYCDDREVGHFVANIDPVSFVELYWRVNNKDRKNKLAKTCRTQI